MASLVQLCAALLFLVVARICIFTHTFAPLLLTLPVRVEHEACARATADGSRRTIITVLPGQGHPPPPGVRAVLLVVHDDVRHEQLVALLDALAARHIDTRLAALQPRGACASPVLVERPLLGTRDLGDRPR